MHRHLLHHLRTLLHRTPTTSIIHTQQPRPSSQDQLPSRLTRKSMRIRPAPAPLHLLHRSTRCRKKEVMQKKRVCVSQCPKQSDAALKCYPTDNIGCSFNNNPMFKVSFYQSTPETSNSAHNSASVGSYCTPTDHAAK